MTSPQVDSDRAYVTPIYTQAEAAHLVGTSTSSLSRWARGYESHRTGRTVVQPPLITSIHQGRGRTVPFVGLSEAYVISAFRAAGLPMQRIRPAVEVLRAGIGLEHALLSEILKTDGADILLDAERSHSSLEDADRRLIVVRNGQAVFREVVDRYLRGLTYRGGFVQSLQIPRYEGVEVVVDPNINGGQPTLARRGIRVEDVVSRLDAGERPTEVADDYRLSIDELESLWIAS